MVKIFKNVLNWEKSSAALIFLRVPNEWHQGKLRGFKIVEGWVMLLLFSDFFGCFYFVFTFSEQEGSTKLLHTCIGAAQFHCTVWCCAVFIKPTNKDNKIDCTSKSREYHLYWRSIYLFKLLEISVTINRKWLQPSERWKSCNWMLFPGSFHIQTGCFLFWGGWVTAGFQFKYQLQWDSYLEMKMRKIWEQLCFFSTSNQATEVHFLCVSWLSALHQSKSVARMLQHELRHHGNSYQNHSLSSDFDHTEWKVFIWTWKLFVFFN